MAAPTLASPPDVTPRDCNPASDDPLHGGLPNFDVRTEKDDVPTATVRKAIDAALAPGAAARQIDLDALKARIPMLSVDSHAFYGTPSFVRSTMAFLTDAAPGVDAKAVATGFVASHQGLFEIDSTELARARVSRDFVTDHNGVRHLTFQQQINGVDLFECEVRANVMPDGRLLNIGSTMLPRPDGDFAVAAPRLTDLDAIRFAAQSAGVSYTREIEPAGAAEGPSQKRTWINTSDFRADEPIVTELVYFAAARGDIRTAWSVVIPVKGVGHTYDIMIDAQTGELLRRQDRLVWDLTPMTFRVFASDGVAPLSPSRPTPDGFQAPEVPRSLLNINPADISTFSPQGWIATGSNDTHGNNVDAHLDLNADNSPDLPRPDGGASRTFDFPFDSTQAPSSWQNFAVTELFWRANWYHDKLMGYGFNEAAGNFQVTNFTGQGVGNDAVQADAQDGSGTNNANFSTTGTDGSGARVQMYVFTGPNPDRDGDLDGDIVYHEMTHGTSIRLHHGLSGTQPQGMGEGWSDFYGITLQAEAGDDPDACYCTGGYTTYLLSGGFTNNYYFGIRRFPYSVDLNKYPLTYADTDTGQFSYNTSIPANPIFIGNSASEVHNVGEIWCNILMDCRAQMWHSYGFPGNSRMIQLVTDGMKLSAANPTFVQARDAILQADLADYGNADIGPLWVAFARHGLGSTAASPNGVSTTGVVESYTLPQYVTFTYPGGRPSTIQPGVPTNFEVDMAPTQLTITPGTATLHYSVAGGAYQTAPLTSLGSDHYTVTIPATPCFSTVNYYITVGTSVGGRSDPSAAPTDVYTTAVVASETTVVTEGFEVSNPGWTIAPGTPAATTGLWTRMTPQATLAQPGAAHTGTYCWVTDGNAGSSIGANDVDGGQTILTSQAYDLSGMQDASISYWRWFSNNQGSNPNLETFLVDVSVDNGATWHSAEVVGPATQNTGGWIHASWTLSSLGLAPSSQVRVRFIAQDLIAAIIEAAVDDFAISSRSCTNPGTCDSADFNCDGNVGTDSDIEAFFACIAGSCPSAPCTNSADFNHDGSVGTDADIEAFFRVLGGGSC